MSVSGNVLKKFRVGKYEKYFILFFHFILNGVKCKKVFLICYVVTLKVDNTCTSSSYYA